MAAVVTDPNPREPSLCRIWDPITVAKTTGSQNTQSVYQGRLMKYGRGGIIWFSGGGYTGTFLGLLPVSLVEPIQFPQLEQSFEPSEFFLLQEKHVIIGNPPDIQLDHDARDR